MKRVRLSLREDLYLLLTFLLDFLALAVAMVFVLQGRDTVVFDEFHAVCGYAVVVNALNSTALGLYYAQSFAFGEAHLCLFCLRLSCALGLAVNSAVGLYAAVTQQGRLGAARPEFQLLWLLDFFCSALFNALLVRRLLPHFRPQGKAAVEAAMERIRTA